MKNDQFHNASHKDGSSDSNLEPILSSIDDTLKQKHKRLFQRGCKWVGIGAFFLGISFGINFVFFHSNGAFIPYMYVLTSLGAICTMKGLVDIFG